MTIHTTKELIKTDRNGTKYFHVVEPCYKCDGRGRIPDFYHIEAGVCFDCGGSGRYEHTVKEYTPEYAEKLLARAKKRLEKQQAEKQAELATKFQDAFPNGKVWFVLGYTWTIKDEIKSDGGKWSGAFKRWYFTSKPEADYDLFECPAEDAFDKTVWDSDMYNFQAKDVKFPAPRKTPSDSKHYGQVGDKVELALTIKNLFMYDNPFGYGKVDYIYIMQDCDGNEFKWKTSNPIWGNKVTENGESGEYIEAERGTELNLKGKVKAHDVYRDVNQTVLTRCKAIIVGSWQDKQ